jgi:hypothetical protein
MKHFWMGRMDAMANASTALYYLFAWLLAVIGYGYLMLFPILAAFSAAFVGYMVTQASPVQWSSTNWIIALAALCISALAAWTTRAIALTRPDLPPGRPVTKADFPLLVNHIKQLAATCNAPALEQIKLTTRFDIEIIRSPVHGFPSSFNHTLMIGLPVMSCLSATHLKLLLAREIGHLAQCRRHYNRRVIYLRSVWQHYAKEYSHDWKPDTLLLRLFFSWYAPFYSLSTETAVKLEEFIKDACMLDIAAIELAAETIAVFEVKKSFIENEFWPELNDMAYIQPRPTWLPYSSMDSRITEKLDKEKAQAYYNNETGQYLAADEDRTLLHQRMKRLGQDEFIIPAHKPESAATHFFGNSLKLIQQQMDNIWYLKNKAIWSKRYQQGINEKKQLKHLRDQAAKALLSNEEAHRYILLLQKYLDTDKSKPLLHEILKTNSHDPQVCFEIGHLLLNANDAQGVDALNLAMEMSAELTVECCRQIVKYMIHSGDMNQAQIYRRKILTYQVAT